MSYCLLMCASISETFSPAFFSDIVVALAAEFRKHKPGMMIDFRPRYILLGERGTFTSSCTRRTEDLRLLSDFFSCNPLDTTIPISVFTEFIPVARATVSMAAKPRDYYICDTSVIIINHSRKKKKQILSILTILSHFSFSIFFYTFYL